MITPRIQHLLNDVDRRLHQHQTCPEPAPAGAGGHWRRIVLFAAVVALTPAPALAHVKWFENEARYPVHADLVFSGRTALLFVTAGAALAVFYALQRKVGDPHWPDFGFLKRMAVGAPTLLAVQAAIGLIYAAAQPTLFAPNLPLPHSALGPVLAGVEVLIGFSFITGIADWVGALLLIALWPLAFFLFPVFDVLDQLFWIGIGVVVLVIGRSATEGGMARAWFGARSPAWPARAVAALRVITGVAIIAPALDEKIWNPALGAAFLVHHPGFNIIMQTSLGLGWFSNDWFVLAAGIVEALIGILLISGLLTRVVILGMWLPFNLGVPFLPPQELLGHLPILGIMYFLLVHSSGIAPGESLHRTGLPGSPSEMSEQVAEPARAPAMGPMRRDEHVDVVVVGVGSAGASGRAMSQMRGQSHVT